MNQPMRELPQYKSHKIVHALKIHNIDYDETGQAVITPEEDGYGPFPVDAEYMGKHKPRIGGYYVVYEDGYKSWSPADAFEKGYTAINGRADIAPCGYIHWEDLAKQLASVWWEVSKVGGTLQHGDLDNAATMFSVCLEQHGGQCFHGQTPMDAWKKAYAWLVSPMRPSLSWTAQCDTLLTKLQSVINSQSLRSYEEMKVVADRLTDMGVTVATTVISEITYQLVSWCHMAGGKTFDSSCMFVLANGAKRSPDAAWIADNRWQTIPPAEKKFPRIAPDFVIELRFEADHLSVLQAKMQEYIDNGVRLGWLIDPLENRVHIYSSGKQPVVLEKPPTVSGGDILQGFELHLDRIF